jgi:hypothetical protein
MDDRCQSIEFASFLGMEGVSTDGRHRPRSMVAMAAFAVQGWKRSARALSAGLLLLGASSLCGCSSAVDQIPTWAGGLPEGAPKRPATPGVYPAVHDMPPARQDVVLTDAERKKLKDDLNSMRTQTETIPPADANGITPGAPAGAPPKP